MNRLIAISVAAVVLVGAVAGGYWLGSRGSSQAPSAGMQATSSDAGKAARKLLYYRNPMGLPDTSPVPKKDPMGMDYLPVYEGEEARDLPPGTVKIGTDKVQLLGVKTEAAQPRELKRTVHAVGTIQPDERLLYKIAPRFEGWIERLDVNTTGQGVSRGQVLMEVYSPELLVAQEEYLIAWRRAQDLQRIGGDSQATMQQLADAVWRRLRNWDISDLELERLRREGKAQRLIAYRSPANGIVLQKPSVQGMRFMPGDVLYEIADLSSVWLIADVSEQDLGLVRAGQQAAVRIVAYPDRDFAGKVVFIYPTLEAATRTARVRIELANRDRLLKPAMYGNVEIGSGAARSKALAVPDSAVLDSGTRQLVLVRRGEGLFEPRDVRLGMRADGYVEVKDGLQPDEEVVVRANFLIDAESNLKAALGSFGSHGQHSGGQQASAARTQSQAAVAGEAPPAAAPGATAAAASAGAAQPHRGEGKVQSVDRGAGTIEIEHGPIASLRWPAMAMEFQVRDRTLLEGIRAGAAVEFDLGQKAPGEFVIERIAAKALPIAPKAAAGHSGH